MINFINKNPKILVIGDLIVDHYLWGSCDRISPEAPVQVVSVEKESTILGGAGNVVNNLKSLGANVDVISIIGDCSTSNELIKLIKDIKVSTKYLVHQKNRVVSKKSRIIAAHQQVVRYDLENSEDIDNESEIKILKTFKSLVKSYDIILLSDYGKGVLTNNLTKSLIEISNINNKKVLVDPKGIDFSKYYGAYLLTPNKKEASLVTKIQINDKNSLLSAAQKLKDEYNLKVSIITLSEQGIAIFENEMKIYPTLAQEVFDVTGAGDTVLASLGFALSSDLGIDEAVKFANLASGIVVGKLGSSTASLDEIVNYETNLNLSNADNSIKTLENIIEIVSELKIHNKKIVFTNGCFDILHTGHVKYLEQAKSFGDVLIVGLNSDRSITRIKGESRPILNQEDRSYILGALEVVDYVVIFEEDTPINLIKHIKPHLLVKGGDYKGQKIIGQDIADELKIVQFIDGKSTTKTIEKIQNL